MFKKSMVLVVFSGLALFSVSVLSESVEKISSTRESVYSNKVALLDTVKVKAERFFETPSEVIKQKNQIQDSNNDLVSTAAGLALLTFGLIGFVMRASRPRI